MNILIHKHKSYILEAEFLPLSLSTAHIFSCLFYFFSPPLIESHCLVRFSEVHLWNPQNAKPVKDTKIWRSCWSYTVTYNIISPLYFPFMARIGGESLAVAQNTYAVNWFKGKELNLVFGLQLSMARLVSILRVKYEHILFVSYFIYSDDMYVMLMQLYICPSQG